MGFFAYPSEPSEIGAVIESAVKNLNQRAPSVSVRTWRATDIAGQFVADKILEAIEGSSFLAADITQPNFNVTFEIGFAIGRGKPLLLTTYAPFTGEHQDYIAKLGIYDTLGYEKIHNSDQLVRKLLQGNDTRPLPITGEPSRSSPVYLLDALYKTNEVG
jgi:hypothetical protein